MDLDVRVYLHAKRQLQRPAWEKIERATATEDEVLRELWTEPDTRSIASGRPSSRW